MKKIIFSFGLCLLSLLSADVVSAATYNVSTCGDLELVDAAEPLASDDIIELNASIACDTVTLGDGGNTFVATFNGNGNTITRTAATPLFDELDGATIRDLIISGTMTIGDDSTGGIGRFATDTTVIAVTSSMVMTSGNPYSYIGGLFGQAAGDMSITSSTFNGSITFTTGTQYVGGFIGLGSDVNSVYILRGNTLSGDISLTSVEQASYVGGMAGQLRHNGVTVVGNTVSSDITITGASSTVGNISLVGGHFGHLDAINSTSTLVLNDLVYSGDINIPEGNDIQGVGGILGAFYGGSATMVDADVTGEIVVDVGGEVEIIGGIFGLADYMERFVVTNPSADVDISITTEGNVDKIAGLIGQFYVTYATTTEAVVTGSITIDAPEYAEQVGGMIGYYNVATGDNGAFSYATSTLDITIDSPSVNDIGGLIGYVNDDIRFDYGYYAGDISISSDDISSDVENVGGLLGHTSYDTYINSSTYAGTITVSVLRNVNNIGGVLGEQEDDFFEFRNVISDGTITITGFDFEDVGGILGGLYDVDDECLIEDSHNSSSIVLTSTASSSEYDSIGGLVGGEESNDDGSLSIRRSYNEGNIRINANQEEVDIEDVGGFVGYLDMYDPLVIEDSYNSGDILIYANATSSVVNYIGGIQSYISEDVEITNVTSTGDITIYAIASSTEVRYVGGIYGYVNDYDWVFDTIAMTGDIKIYANAPYTEVRSIGGVFGYAEDGTELQVENAYFDGEILVDGGYRVYGIGGFLGLAEDVNYFYVSSTYAHASTTVSLGQDVQDTLQGVGGFIGSAISLSDFIITDAFSAGTLHIIAVDGIVEGDGVTDIGGFYGEIEDSITTNAYADVDITVTTENGEAPLNIGGFAGEAVSGHDVEIVNSFAAGAIEIDADAGGVTVGAFLGQIGDADLTNNYFDATRTGISGCASDVTSPSGCTAYNTDGGNSSYLIGNDSNDPVSSWDFDTVWQIDEAYYPVFLFSAYDGTEEATTQSQSGSSGGGGAANRARILLPTLDDPNATLMINNGAVETNSVQVELTIPASSNASEMAVSNDSAFGGGAVYVPYATSAIHTLTPGNGQKTVYVRLRRLNGGTLDLSDTILLVGQLTDQMSDDPANCPLDLQQAYSVPGESAVYYVTEECTKRAFRSPVTYFTYFTSWSDVNNVSATTLASIPDDTLGFMPLGPLYDPASGTLIKTPSNPDVYLLLNGERYLVDDEAAALFQFGEEWASWIEDVDARLIEQTPEAAMLLGTTTRPDGMIVKYGNEARTYQLDDQELRWIPSEAIFTALGFRWDRIVTIPETETYPIGFDLTQ